MKKISAALPLLAGFAFLFFSAGPAFAAPPAGFQNQLLASGLNEPTDMAYAPDGRIFITQKNGTVVVYEDGSVVSTPALTLPSISTGGDRGLLSIALDPNFSTDHWLYLAYTTSDNHERISRFTMNGNVIDPNSELILLENPSVWSGFLNAVTIRYNPVDGKLYASFGSDGLTSNSQDLSNLNGKLLRINLDGSIPADNPFANLPGAQGAIWSYGFRNPWKINVDPSNGTVLVGDVGENTWEKVVRSAKGANFGWPMFEGDCSATGNCDGVTPPIYVYNHNGQGAAVLGGDIYSAAAFPAQYQHNYFFGDYVKGTVTMLSLDGSGSVTATSTFDTGLGALSAINTESDGCLYYLTIFPGTMHRYCYGNVQPVLNAQAAASPSYGALPLTVQFSSSGSTDSSGTALSYAWDFGDGATSTGVNPSHIYTKQGVYTVTLTASDANGSKSASTKVWAGYMPPNPSIADPTDGLKYSDGDTIHFSGSASDPQDGTLPAPDLTWIFTFHHNTHIHPPAVFPGVAQGTFSVPVADEPSPITHYEIDLTATDSVGLASTTVINIYPNISTTTYESDPSGAQLLLDAQPITTPYADVSVAGFHHTLSVNSPQTIGGTAYNFLAWSNGGAQTQTFVTPLSDSVMTAQFGTGTPAISHVTSGASLDAPTYDPGQALFVNASATDSANLQNALIDIELWGPGGKIGQNITPESFSAGAPVSASWNTTAPLTPGTYTVKVGVFSSDWATLYGWNDNAATFTVSGATSTPPTPPPSGFSVTLGASPDATAYAPGGSATITTTATPSGATSTPLILDTELWSNGAKVAQNHLPLDLSSGAATTFAWHMSVPAAPGTYTIKIGAFSSDWTTLYSWSDNAGTFTVSSATSTPVPPSTVFVVSASMPQTDFSPGAGAAITTNVSANATLSNVVVDTEVFDQNGTKVLQNDVPANIAAGQQFTSSWNATVPNAPGLYTVKVGIFAADWSSAYFWQNRAFQFYVGTPPPPPQSGTTYSITVLQPQNNQTVSGTQEIRAVIPGLDIGSYNIAWQTGGGALDTLDTDPITQAYKHAWINFDPWTWEPNHTYPVTFIATDLSNNVIGSTTIDVTH